MDKVPISFSTQYNEELSVLDFALSPELEAKEPSEARGLARDEVRLMVSYISTNTTVHTQFRHIGDFLRTRRCAGDKYERNVECSVASYPI